MALLMCTSRYCGRCKRNRKFLPVHFAALVTGVNRSSLYRWMNKGWLHWLELPSGRRLVCLGSLTKVHEVDPFLVAKLIESRRLGGFEGDIQG
jgi:predicted DNA-binding transcriptional regulator AlpA